MKNKRKNKKFHLITLCTAFGCLLVVGGCRSASIRVLDSESRMPLSHATIEASNINIITVWPREQKHETDKDGKAKVVKTGILLVVIRKENYKKIVFTIQGNRYLASGNPDAVVRTSEGFTVYMPRKHQ